jgi:hypothetical protein
MEVEPMPNQLEKMASEAAGAIKGAKAKVEGLTGVFAHLSREHGEVTALLLRVNASRDPQVRRELFPDIRVQLLAHDKGEQLEVYPAFEKHEELAPFAREHDREVGELEQAIATIAKTDYGDEQWPRLFSELVDSVSHHVKEEEGTFFPAASRIFGREESERMVARYEAAKTDAMKGAIE